MLLPHMTDTQNGNLKSDLNDISSIFGHYRVSARAIWNTAFWPDPDFRNWDSIDQFHEIQKFLFRELVLARANREWPLQDLFENAIPFFRIVPLVQAPIMIQKPRPEAPRGYWDDAVDSIKPGQGELLFIAYFDWNELDYIDLRYYRIKIASFDAHPELVGREALIDCQQAAVHLVNG
jgi:hypothetical protein